MPLSAGDKLRNYEILRTVGQGGMGAVYHVRSAEGSEYAIKEMVIDIRDPYERKRAIGLFASEADLLRQLDHPKLVKSHDFFSVDDSHFMVMDYIDGQTLAEVLEQRVELPALHEVLDWADQICEALEYLHGRVPIIIFRDLKPSNVMLDKAGGIHLIDFGIARVFEDESRTNTFIKGVGSKGFAPIEQYGAGGTDPRSDVYSLGATLYNLLSGEKPPASIGMLAGTDLLEPIRAYNPSVPRELERIVLVSMALKKENRPASITEMRQLLHKVANQTGSSDHTDQLTGALTDEDFDLEAVLEATRPTAGQAAVTAGAVAPGRLPFSRGFALALVLLTVMAVGTAWKVLDLNKPPPPEKEWIPIAKEIPWRYLDDGSNPKDTWRDIGFDDSAWPSGMERLGYGDLVTTKVGFGPNPEKKFLTTYFRKKFSIKDAKALAGANLRLRVIRDDGALVWLNGKEILRSNLPRGKVDSNTKALGTVGGAQEQNHIVVRIDPSLLKTGDNLIAAEVHQVDRDSSDMTFEALLEQEPTEQK